MYGLEKSRTVVSRGKGSVKAQGRDMALEAETMVSHCEQTGEGGSRSVAMSCWNGEWRCSVKGKR